jgi:hypothetical protein
MNEDATLKVGNFTVHVDYYDSSNSIHVSATRNGKDYWADITELTHQSNEDGSKWLALNGRWQYEDDDPIVKLTAAQWKRVDEWLIAEDHY